MTKHMHSDKGETANVKVLSFQVARPGASISWNDGQSSCASLANIVQSGIRQAFLEHFPDKAQNVAQTLEPLREQIIPCSPNLSDSV
jgi:hypothetical protein